MVGRTDEVDALTLPFMAHGEADCTTKVLHVREEPSLQAKIIGSLVAGQRVTVWAAGKPWWLVQAADGLTGWAYGEYLKPVKDLVRAASLTVVQTVEGDMTASNASMPVVLDLNGTMRDWAWLRAKYGNVSYLEAAGYPKFQLSKVEEMEGPQTMMVSLEAENGTPHSGQPVVLSWPSLAQPSADIPAIPSGSKSCYTSRGVIQKTENGCTGFGLGGGSYIHDPAVGGPYSVFVLSPSTFSDCLTGTGWLGGTNHMGPCRLTFRIVAAGVAPEPEPEPGADDDVLVKLDRMMAILERSASAAERLAGHLGA
jgi:hypothetical protein